MIIVIGAVGVALIGVADLLWAERVEDRERERLNDYFVAALQGNRRKQYATHEKHNLELRDRAVKAIQQRNETKKAKYWYSKECLRRGTFEGLDTAVTI